VKATKIGKIVDQMHVVNNPILIANMIKDYAIYFLVGVDEQESDMINENIMKLDVELYIYKEMLKNT